MTDIRDSGAVSAAAAAAPWPGIRLAFRGVTGYSDAIGLVPI